MGHSTANGRAAGAPSANGHAAGNRLAGRPEPPRAPPRPPGEDVGPGDEAEPPAGTPTRLADVPGLREAHDRCKDDHTWPAWYDLPEEVRDALLWGEVVRADEDLGRAASGDPPPAAGAALARFVATVTAAEGPGRPAADEDAALSRSFTLTNCAEAAATGGRTTRPVTVGRTAADVAHDLSRLTGDWPRRVGRTLFAVTDDNRLLWLETTDDLFAWIGAQAGRPVRWAGGDDKVTKGVFHAHLKQTARAYEALETLPHHPRMPGHAYLHPPPGGGDGRALDGLVDRFSPASDADRSLIRAAVLTLFWGGRPGSRPAFLFAAEEDDGEGGRGAGKSTLAKMLGHLAGGHFDARPGDDFGRLMSRLLTPDAATLRVALLDNVKTLRFSWADLEGLITNDVLNGHRLFAGDARRPNTLTWLLTLNGTSLSKDLAQRCVIVWLRRPPRDPSWEEDTRAYIDAHRWAIVGDALAALRGPKVDLAGHSRWAAWEAGVLAACPLADECQRVIAERQAAVDADQEEADLVRGAFAAALRQRGHDPDAEVVFIPSKDAAQWLEEATGEQRATQRASAYLTTLALPELKKGNDGTGNRGWRWVGRKAPAGATAKPLRSLGEGVIAALGAARSGKPPTRS